MSKLPDDFEVRHLKREQCHRNAARRLNEIIRDESGLEIGETGTLKILDTNDCGHDPRNHTGKQL